MALIAKHNIDIELKTQADKMWSAVKDLSFTGPKIFPDIYHSIEVLEGDGRSAGSLRKITNVAPGEGLERPVEKSKIVSVDDENKTICYSIVEGDILKHYKSFVDTVSVRASKDGGSVVRYSFEYEKINEDAPDADHVKDVTVDIFHRLDAHLQDHPTTMALNRKIEMDAELKTSADRFWRAIGEINHLFPKLFPDIYKSIEVLEGDGTSAGTIRRVTFGEGLMGMPSTTTRIDILDEASKTISHSVLEGAVLQHYKRFGDKMVVEAKGEGCVVHWSCEYEKISEDAPEADSYKDFTVNLFQKFDAYLFEESKKN